MIRDRETLRTSLRILHKEVLRPAIHPVTTPLDVTAHHVHGEPIGVEAAMGAAYEPFSVGQAWGGRWDTTWFHLTGAIPAEWAGRDVVARIELGGGGVPPSFTAEGLIWVDGVPVQGLHHEHVAYPLHAPASGGEAVDLYVEGAANPTAPFHSREWPLLAADVDGPTEYQLRRAELAVVDREVEALWLDLRVLLQVLDHVPEHPRNEQVLDALHECAKVLDRRDLSGTAKAAREALAPALARPSTLDHTVTAVGHAHIDTAWLWPIRETKRKAARSFANQLRLMEQYPEHHFVASQAVQYAWMRDGYPELFEQIKARVAEGRWEPVGGMWVEPDANLPSGESLVRQVVHGQRFFLEELDVECTELWIPDVFGYCAALPQIAREAGIRALITQKLSWNTTNRFPHSTFQWEGLDGSRIVTHFPPANTYNGSFHLTELRSAMTTFADHGRSDRSLYPFGYGDGGGGPTRQLLELARRTADLEGLPRMEVGSVRDFVDAIEADADAGRLDTWVGELYLEYHRGTYTTQAATKEGNRRGQDLLRSAELWAAARCVREGDWSTYPAEALDRAWKTLLTDQFHDIIPGSSIHWVYEDAARDYAEVAAVATAVAEEARAALVEPGDGQVVFNPSSRTRLGEVIDVDGVPTIVSAPGAGWAALPAGVQGGSVQVTDRWIENALLRVEWDGDGLLTSVFDREAGREVLAAGTRANVFQLFEDHPNDYDAWDIDSTYVDRGVDLVDVESIEIVEDHPRRGGVRFTRRFGSSTISQVLQLSEATKRIDFVTEVDWQEDHRLLKVAFPLAIRTTQATYEVQHGWTSRPTVRNTSWDTARFEVCAQRWADLSETGYGVALLNDCKHGYDALGNVLRLSLLRAPGWPDPTADRGQHSFTYALLPHLGTAVEGGVIEEAAALNEPLVVVRGTTGRSSSFVSVDRPGVSIEAVKKADRADALVVRLCEVAGSREPITLSVDGRVTAAHRADLLERPVEELEHDANGVRLRLRPFQLVTLLLEVEPPE